MSDNRINHPAARVDVGLREPGSPERPHEVPQAFNALEKTVQLLRDEWEALYRDLAPALSNGEPRAGALVDMPKPGNSEAMIDRSCVLAHSILETAANLEAIRIALSDARHRLEL